MNSSFSVIRLLFTNFKIKRLKTPEFLTGKISRVLFLVLFLSFMAIARIVKIKAGMNLDILLYLTVASILVTLLFEEKLWHRHICPLGSILSVTSRFSPLKIKIDEDSCISCGKCQKVCPTGAIETVDNKKRRVVKNECLLCGRCEPECPVDLCSFKMK